MLIVAPLEECEKMPPRVLHAIEALGEIGPVLGGFELCFGERVVVGEPRTREARGRAQVGRINGLNCLEVLHGQV